MAVELTSIPQFEYSGFYYFEIYRDLTNYTRLNVPEITDESDEEPFEQLKRAWALAHHLMNTRLDVVANETLLPTARLLESVRSQLKLIDFKLLQATPSTTELVMEFSSLFTTVTLIVPRNSQFGTEDTEALEQIIFEAVQDNSVTPTDRLQKVYANPTVLITLSNKSGNIFDYVSSLVPKENDIIIQGNNYAIISEVVDGNTIRVNDPTNINNGAARLSTSNFSSDRSGEAFTAGLTFTFNGAEPEKGDSVYLGHDTVMWDMIRYVRNQAFKTGISGVWEYYDGNNEDANPDLVTNLGGSLEIDLTTLLGTVDRTGTVVRVAYALTSTSEEVVSYFDAGVNKVRTTGLLGQIAPSLTETDYIVGTVWSPLEEVDGSYDEGAFSKNGDITFEVPQTLKKNWQKTEINGQLAFWLRFRVQGYTKTAAFVLGTGFNSVGLDSSNYKLKLEFDALGSLEFDATGNLGATPGTYTPAGIATIINTALAGLHASLSGACTVVSGQLKLTAPNAALGKDSLVRFLAPVGQDATFELFGLSEAGHPHSFVGVGGTPVIDQFRIDEGKQYLLFQVVQGETVVEEPLGSSNGSPSQEFVLTHKPMVDGTLLIEVDEGSGFTEYTRVENFLNSDSAQKAYTVEITADDEVTVKFGDGISGKIPPPGVDNIRATYRIGADVDGNVGAQTITVNRAGISFVDRVFNPRGATGWAPKEGSTEDSLAAVKIEGPASLRTLGRAITSPDIETLAKRFISPTTGSQPVFRALAIEETYGVKTVELVVVGGAGALLNQTQREELDDYFNGNKVKGIDGVLVTNHEVTTVNYTPKVIDVSATVTGGQEEPIKNAIRALLNPSATFDDGVTPRWNFGAEVPLSIIVAAIHDVDPTNIKKVVLTVPGANVQLQARELPLAGVITVTII